MSVVRKLGLAALTKMLIIINYVNIIPEGILSVKLY